MDKPVLHGGDAIAQYVGIHRFLAGILREMSDSVRNLAGTFSCVEHTFGGKEIIHVSAAQLSDALLLRHTVVEFIDLSVNIRRSGTSCQYCRSEHYR